MKRIQAIFAALLVLILLVGLLPAQEVNAAEEKKRLHDPKGFCRLCAQRSGAI